MKVSEIKDKLREMVGDGTMDISTSFIINGLNWAFNELPRVPKLDKLFSKHYTFNLDAKDHYKWNLNKDFRRISNMPFLNFYTSTGGDPCKLCICHKPVAEFYKTNGLVSMKQPGKPCQYTIETEGDNVWLVLDRPSDVPIIIDYIAYGYPKPVETEEDEVEISAIAENLILDTLKTYLLREADDYAFAADVDSYLDNKKVIEAQQELYHRWGNEAIGVLGEVS